MVPGNHEPNALHSVDGLREHSSKNHEQLRQLAQSDHHEPENSAATGALAEQFELYIKRPERNYDRYRDSDGQ